MKNLLLLFILLTFNSFSQEIGDKKFVNATLSGYLAEDHCVDFYFLLYFVDSNEDTITVSSHSWLLDEDIFHFALDNKGNSFELTLLYTNFQAFGKKERDWTLIKLENL